MLQQFWENLKNWIVTPSKIHNNSTRCGRINNNDFGLKAATSVLVAKIAYSKVLASRADNEDIYLQDFSISKIKQKGYQSLINGKSYEKETDKGICYSKLCCQLDNDYSTNDFRLPINTTATVPSMKLSRKKSLPGNEYNYKYYCPYKSCTYQTIRPTTLHLHIVHTHDLNFPAFNGNYRGNKVTFRAPDGTRILFDEKSRNTVNLEQHIAFAVVTKTSHYQQ